MYKITHNKKIAIEFCSQFKKLKSAMKKAPDYKAYIRTWFENDQYDKKDTYEDWQYKTFIYNKLMDLDLLYYEYHITELLKNIEDEFIKRKINLDIKLFSHLYTDAMYHVLYLVLIGTNQRWIIRKANSWIQWNIDKSYIGFSKKWKEKQINKFLVKKQ